MAHKGLKLYHLSVSLVALVMFVLAVFINVNQSSLIKAETTVNCGGMGVVLKPLSGFVAQGQTLFKAYVSGGTPSPIDKVDFILNSLDAANGTSTSTYTATQNTAEPQYWIHNWESTTVDNGLYEVIVRLQFVESSEPNCLSDPVQFHVDNPPASGGGSEAQLEVELFPHNWVGPTNEPVVFEAVALLIDGTGGYTDVTNGTTFTWQKTIGTFTSVNGNRANYFSASTTGTGKVKVYANYGTRNDYDYSDITVLNPSDSSSYPLVENGDSSTSDTSNGTNDVFNNPETEKLFRTVLNSEPYVFDISLGREGDTRLAACFASILQKDDYEDLVDGKRRLTYREFVDTRNCFGERRNIVPVNLAPLEPEKVRETSEFGALKISKVENIESAFNVEGVGLKISGEAEAGQNLLIYVFSQPLVLTTQASDDGKWSYVLEDPLEPGNHEVYVLVEKDNNFVRSGAYAFAIAANAASEDNPEGYSLVLASSAADSQIGLYIASGAAVVLVASVLLARLVWFKRKPLQINESEPVPHSPSLSGTEDSSNEKTPS